ncbi:aldehyde dehydrogenase family protein [Roseibium aestuarii]|uniref:Aldehyde dehydrogenase family protein n=1 Tax=Roseibium aestuarii TaxID=2600299 RepID=A0ABW4JVJ7_9HYPH|nr:aldehyde dehydrogenase family protein [Roseibium aestuarii]
MTDVQDLLEPEFGALDQVMIAGRLEPGEGDPFDLLDKYTLKPFCRLRAANAAQVTRTVEAAHAAFRAGAPGPHDRGEILQRTIPRVLARQEEFVSAMVREAGFTRSDAAGEVKRCLETLRLSAEEARRLSGEVIPLEGAPGQSGRIGFTLRVPLGVIAAITPFNSPLNTVTHKVAPGFAAGNAVILKPSSQTPLTAMLLARCLVEAGMPEGFLSVLQGGGDVAQALLADERVRFFAFTGSTEVGRAIQEKAGLRRTQMELGSIAFTLVCADADLDRALPKIVNAAYRKAGQVCTSIQMLLIEEPIYSTLAARLADRVEALSFGNPNQPDTFVGPMISEREAIRVETWVHEAIAQGARCLAGGRRQGAVMAPTLLENVSPEMKVGCREIFGPVMCLAPFASLPEAVERVNATPFGLASGLFTNHIGEALRAALSLEVGGVHINETSSSRVDLMPYGGSKDSGFGREGPRYAVHEMTEERVITISTL